MVGAEDVGVNGRVVPLVVERGGGEPVVEAPPDVAFAGVHAVGPPRVGTAGGGIFFAKSIGESRIEEGGEAGAFLVGESRVAAILLGVG